MVGSLLLAAALSFSGIRVVDNREACRYEPDLMGEYVLDSRSISICTSNVVKKGHSRDFVLKHEAIHAAHHNLGWKTETFIKEPLLTFLTRRFMDDGETLGVLLNYDGSTDQEFDARLLSKLPSHVVALLIVVSHVQSAN